MEPTCPDTHTLDKSKCECVEKRKRCPKGTRPDKKTGECVAHTTRKVSPRKASPRKASPSKASPRKASPKQQTRRRKLGPRTGSFKTFPPPLGTLKKAKKRVTIAENVIKGAVDEVVEGKEFAENKLAVQLDPSPRNLQTQQKDFVASVQRSLVKSGSFSPAVNRQLISLKNGTVNPLFACGAAGAFAHRIGTTSRLQVGVLTKAGHRCVGYTTQAAGNAMISTLKANKPLVCSELIMPVQDQTNCWFNTWFAAFFVSDKGRKFFRYLRQYMINGKTLDGQSIQPKSLANTLRLLNLCIEATYNNSGLAEPALVINTNSVIRSLHTSIEAFTASKRGARKGLPAPGSTGNPFNFYNILVSYLSEHLVQIGTVWKERSVEHIDGKIKRVKGVSEMDVVVMRTYDNLDPRRLREKVAIFSSQLEAPLSFPSSDSKYKFVLDSVIIRDIRGMHFVALVTCNGNQMGYDGAGLTALKPFMWKDLVSSKKQWKLPGSRVTCSFAESYCEYVYYKAKA